MDETLNRQTLDSLELKNQSTGKQFDPEKFAQTICKGIINTVFINYNNPAFQKSPMGSRAKVIFFLEEISNGFHSNKIMNKNIV